jgi:nascent polypeptide-associated complex subunit alpha
MLPGLPGGGLSPKKMQAMMKQMGIDQKEIPAERVIIEKPDGKTIISNPSVQKITMQGQESYQISGDETEESQEVSFSEEDINLILEKTSCTREEAKKALEETNDIAEAIEKLSN